MAKETDLIVKNAEAAVNSAEKAVEATLELGKQNFVTPQVFVGVVAGAAVALGTVFVVNKIKARRLAKRLNEAAEEVFIGE